MRFSPFYGLTLDSEFAERMERRRRQEAREKYEEARRSWCVGSEEFRQELITAAGGRVGASHYSWQRQESGEQKAERMIGQGLKELGWDETDLERRRKGDAGKVKLARRLRGETTMTLAWIARRLKMGAWTYVANLIYAATRKAIKS